MTPHPIFNKKCRPYNASLTEGQQQSFETFVDKKFKRALERMKENPTYFGFQTIPMTNHIVDELLTVPNIEGILALSGLDVRGAAQPMINAIYSKMFTHLSGTIIETTSELEYLLENTDIQEIPANQIKFPYPVTYVKFSKPISSDVCKYVITGAYLAVGSSFSKQVDASFDINSDAIQIGATSVLKGYSDYSFVSYLGGGRVDANSSDSFLKKISEEFQEYDVFPGQDTVGLQDLVLRSYGLIIKTMLYMGLKDFRSTKNNALLEYTKKWGSLGKKRQDKTASQANLKYNSIIVGPESLVTKNLNNLGGKVSSHMRRGHFRNQRFGEGLKDSHIVWIQPVIVNAVEDEVPAPKTYKIKM